MKLNLQKDRLAARGSDPALTSRRAFFGTVALSVVNSARFALQLVVLPILARILGPAAFGLVSMAMPFILFANMLSDAGMGSALIRRQNPSPQEESTVFWITVGVGLVIALVVCALSVPAANVLGQPEVAKVLVALSPILILSSSLSVANARIARARHFGLFACGDVMSTILSSGAAILTALHGYGVWSLVIQQIVLWLTKACWILSVSRFRPLLICHPSLAKGLLAFGLNNVGASISDFVGKNAPTLIIGSQLGVLAVGHYALAYQLVRIPFWIISGPLWLATFTAVSGLAASSGAAAPLSLRTMRMMVAVLAPAFCGLALVADLLFSVFLGPKWQGAAPALAILAGVGLMMCIYSLIGAVLMGLGRADLQLRLSILSGLTMICGAVIGSRFGLELATAGISVGAGLAFPFYVSALAKQLRMPSTAILSNITSPLIATIIMALAVLAVRHQIAGLEPRLELAACVLTGLLAFAASLAINGGRQMLQDLKQTMPGRGTVHQKAA